MSNVGKKLTSVAILGGLAGAVAAAATRLLGKSSDPLPVPQDMKQTLAKVRVYSQLF